MQNQRESEKARKRESEEVISVLPLSDSPFFHSVSLISEICEDPWLRLCLSILQEER